MMSEAIRLSIQFFKEIKGFEEDSTGKVKAPDKYKVTVMQNIEQILAGGTNPKDLEQYMYQYKQMNPDAHEAYNVDDILKYLDIHAKKVEVKRDPNNILEHGKFYYHPALQVAPPPPVVIQLDDGTFQSSYDNQEFFLEVKESFTFEDLVAYFYKVMEHDSTGFKERDIGAFKHIMKSYDIDTVLYTIDASRFLAEDYMKPLPKNPFEIRDYVEDGMQVLEERKNTCYMEGLDRVIPRAE